MTKAFPPYRLDTENQCLWREDVRIPLPPKAFAVLSYLVERAGRLVTQDELLEKLWVDTYVQPEVLRKYILEIRRILEDPAKNPHFIETVQKRGYRFLASVRDETTARGQLAAGRLVGRDESLNQLTDFLGAATQGQKQIVFVTGEAGIGKTSLVDAFQEHALQEGQLQLARGQCVEGFGGKEAYYPVLEALALLMRGPHAEQVIRILRSHAPAWLIQFPSAVRVEDREFLLREILGATRERMVREFCETIEALTAELPLVLILEDLQWVDDSTLDLISALARRRSRVKLMLVATHRPVDPNPSRSPLKLLKQELLIHHLCHEIQLERLTEPQVEQYLESELPAAGGGPPLASLIHRHSDGNPLFMVALLARLRQQGFIEEREGRWKLRVSADQLNPGIPETLQQMLEAQMDQLDGQERRLLRASSVAGQRFSAWAAGILIETPVAEAEEICERLAARRQFVKRVGIYEMADGTVSAQYEFQHALYREALYRQLPPAQVRQFHLRLAQGLEDLASPPDPALASELAEHFEAGRDYARAIRYLILTAGNAGRRYAHSDSVRVLRHASDLLGHVPLETAQESEIDILERISDVLYAQGEMQQSVEIDGKVADLAEQRGFKAAQVDALTRQARALAFLAPERCVTVCERAVEISRTLDDPLLQARAEMLMACWHVIANGGDAKDAAICAAAREKIQSLSDQLPAYYEILYAHVQFTQSDFVGAYQTANAGIPKSIENDNLVVYFSAHSSLAQALLHLGRWGELLSVIRKALEAAEKNGNAPWEGIFRATLAWTQCLACDYRGARTEAERLLQRYTDEPAGQIRTMALIAAGFASLGLKECDRALDYFRTVCQRPADPRTNTRQDAQRELPIFRRSVPAPTTGSSTVVSPALPA